MGRPRMEMEDVSELEDGVQMKVKRRKRKLGSNKSKFPLRGRELSWRNVTPVSNSLSLLVGSEEGGFLSLEEIDGDVFDNLGSEVRVGDLRAGVDAEGEEDIPPASAETKRRKKNKGVKNQDGVPPSDDADTFLQEASNGRVLKRRERRKHLTKGKGSVNLNSVDALEAFGEIEDESTVTTSSEAGQDGVIPQQGLVKKKKKAKLSFKQRRAKRLKLAAANGEGAEAIDEGDDTESADLVNEDEPDRIREVVARGSLKVKRPKLGSKARKAKRQKHGEAGEQVVEVAEADEREDGTKPAGLDDDKISAETTAEVSEEESFDLSAWAGMRLHPLLAKAVAALKFKEPTPIQRDCIPAAAHKGKDVIGAAETGSGKTLAFGIPILQRLLEEQDKAACSQGEGEDDAEGGRKKRRYEGPLRALIVTPTRELAIQICDHMHAVAKFTTIKIVPIVGGMATQKQQRLLKYKPEIIVGTPGRLWELMSNGENHLLELHSLSFFVLDEADRMVEKGHFKELQSIIDMLPSSQSSKVEQDVETMEGEVDDLPKSRKRRQILVFSATLALPENFKTKLKKRNQGPKGVLKSLDSVAALSERAGVSHKAAIIDLTSTSIVARNLTESVVEDEDKDQFLYYILKIHGGGRTIVFCTSIAALRRVSAILKLLQVPVLPLHAQMQQKQRLKAMDRFRGSEDGVLVATDVAARGLDVPNIRTVVHYQLPHSAEIYVHRSGRTARASTDGCSIALVSPSDRSKYLTLCRALSRAGGFQPFPINMAYMPAIEKRVELANKLDKFMRRLSQSKATHAWLARNADAMEIDMQESEDEDGASNTNQANKNSTLSKRDYVQLQILQEELRVLLDQPVKPKAFSSRYVTGTGMSHLVTKQLQDYASAMSGAGKFSSNKRKVVVIGQEKMEPLEVLRLSAADHTVRKPGRKKL